MATRFCIKLEDIDNYICSRNIDTTQRKTCERSKRPTGCKKFSNEFCPSKAGDLLR